MAKVRLEEGLDGHGLTFELVLLDGREDDEWPISTQIADSSVMDSLARDFGWEGLEEGQEDIGQAYDFLEAHLNEVIEDPGYFTPAEIARIEKINEENMKN